MKPVSVLLGTLLTASTSAQLFLPLLYDLFRAPTTPPQAVLQSTSSPTNDMPPILPFSSSSGPLILSDILSKDRALNIFAGFTRDIDAITSRLSSANTNSTILAPTNSAITSLPRKPWEDPPAGVQGQDREEAQGGEEKAHYNLRKFVEAHIVPKGGEGWAEGEKVKTLGGGEVWWESREEDGRVVMPGGVQVVSRSDEVQNGQIWVLKEALNYS